MGQRHSVGDDPCWTLLRWQEFIASLIEKHGPSATLEADAGHNNVELIVEEADA